MLLAQREVESLKRIDRADQLPRPGALSAEVRESGDLDFKAFADAGTLWEHAKDVAAFANALGGTLLVGAYEDDVGALTYPGVRGQSPKEVQTIYERAAGICSPPVAVDSIAIELGTGCVVVAVNVEPATDAVIAAPVSTRTKQGIQVLHSRGWFYPRRVSSQTFAISPSEAPMYMTKDARRGFLLVNRIPVGSRRGVTVLYASPRERTHGGLGVEYKDRVLDLEQASLESNFVEFSSTQGSTKEIVRVPIMDVLDIWEHLPGKWSIRLAGGIAVRPGSTSTSELVYMPMWR